MPNAHKPWIDGHTIPSALAETVRQFPKRDALVFPKLGIRWNYEEFAHRTEAVARSLLAIDVKPGEHLGIWATNWPEWILTQFAAASIGAVLVNVNPAYRVHELAYVLEQADIVALVLTDTFKSTDYETIVAGLIPDLDSCPKGKPLTVPRLPKFRQLVSIKDSPKFGGIQSWSEFLKRGEGIAPAAVHEISRQLHAQDPVNIQYTSGTTGAPKGAMLSHSNILHNAFYVGDRMRITEQDRVAIPVPFYHCFGCVMGIMMCSLYGAAMVVPAESFDPEDTLDAVERERCTALYGVPTMFNAEIHSPSFASRDFQSLRTGIMAGSPCPIELMRQVTSRMNLSEMTIAYGLTEASPVITQTETTEPLEIRVTTVGKPIPGVEVKLVDPVTEEETSDNQPGELWARGHGIMIGYYNKPEATAQIITPDGWLKTGDLAQLTPTGHYRITGRIKDMIIRGGENVYPREIEEFLITHPMIREVQVVGLPDQHYGEQISAWIILKSKDSIDEAELKEFCKRNIAHYKVPRYFVFVDEFPLTVTGKVQKFRLRELGITRFQLHDAAKTETA
ncbi:MAG: AMP-binding protein [Planctomycetota bacterium]